MRKDQSEEDKKPGTMVVQTFGDAFLNDDGEGEPGEEQLSTRKYGQKQLDPMNDWM